MTETPQDRGAVVPTTDARPTPGVSGHPTPTATQDGAQPRAGHWMQVYTGRQFWPLDPRVGDFDIRDIAHSLSLTCRYNGHVDRFYSVAEHSCLVASAVSPANRLWGLMHDAAEAYVGDMVRPLKRSMPEFEEVEAELLYAIAGHFGLPGSRSAGLYPAEVIHADNRILLDERAALLKAPPASWGIDGLDPLGVEIIGLEPQAAEEKFLDMFVDLTKGGA